jgi:predicted transcriptional regulator
MNRLNHKIRKARKELRHLRVLDILYNKGPLGIIDPSTAEKRTKLEYEVWYFVAIWEAIHKGYKKGEMQ